MSVTLWTYKASQTTGFLRGALPTEQLRVGRFRDYKRVEAVRRAPGQSRLYPVGDDNQTHWGYNGEVRISFLLTTGEGVGKDALDLETDLRTLFTETNTVTSLIMERQGEEAITVNGDDLITQTGGDTVLVSDGMCRAIFPGMARARVTPFSDLATGYRVMLSWQPAFGAATRVVAETRNRYSAESKVW